MEVKSVSMGWYEKCDISENELLYAEELLTVDNDLKECDNILSEVGLQTGYSGYEKQIYEIAEKRQHLWDFVQALMGYIEIHLDEPLRKNLNHGACETISRIHMEDFQVENTLGVQTQVDARGYKVAVAKDKLTLKDFLGNAIGENARTNIPNLNGTTCECVEEFAVIFQQQYDNMLAAGMLGEDIKNLEDYLDQFASMGEYDHKEDQPFYKALLSNVLDLTIIKPLIESCCGYDLITGEDLTEMERNMKVIGALVDLVTLATGIYGFTTAAKNMGWKKAASYFGQLALVELASDVSATTVATIGDYCDWPMGVTMLLSLGTGLTVGQVGNHLIFKRNGIEIFRKEVSESGEFLEDLMSPEDAARFRKFLEEGSTAGLTPEELAGIGKVDDYLALNRVDYDDVLALRRSAAESGSDVFEEIHWEDLMSPEDAARFRKFLEEGSTAGLTPEELAGLGKVDDYLALNKVKYDDVLALRKEAIEGGTEAIDELKRVDEIKVEFNYNSKYDETEFARQLADQQKGMNELTVQEYLDNRQKYIEQGRAIEGNAAQQAAREKAFVDKVDELQDAGLSLKEAEAQAQKWLDTQAALHNPDQVAGGYASNVGGIGDKGVNSSIGSQWRYRIDDVDAQIQKMAESMSEAEKKSTYLNVNLIYKGD